MRLTSLALAALTGIAVSAFATPAGALTPDSSSGMRAAAESVDPLAIVHCRQYKHRSYNHGWSYGCGGGYSVRVHRRGVVEKREGRRGRVGIHERSTTRSETNVRSRESTTTRGERRTGGGSEKSGSTPGGTTGNKGSGAGGGGGTPGQSSGGQR